MFRGSFRAVSSGGGGGGSADLTWSSTSSTSFSFSGNTNAVRVDVSSNAVDVILPAPGGSNSGKIFTIKHIAGDLNTNNLTVTPTSGSIDDAASVTMFQNKSSIRVSSDGSNWNVI